jgi:hypothetical protein
MSISAVKEEVVAVLPTTVTPDEKKISKEVTAIEFQAESIIIQDDADYQQAAEFGRTIKQKAAEVVEFFKPMKDSAYKAHKEICDREKMMLTPLKNAENILKKTMSAYALEQERKRKALEEEMRRKAEEEANRKIEEAIALEEQGKIEEAEAAMLDAQITDSVARGATLVVEKPKAEGVSVSKDWEIVSINDAIVPLKVAGVTIRPVDEKAVMRLIRASKGTVSIPGVVYKETAKMSFRR